jgi:hypothetical protein
MECDIINVDWFNFVVTSLLSLLLIVLTVRISKKQNKLQEQISKQQNDLQDRISNDQNQLQKLIAEKDIQISLYQHRMKCYLYVMDALDIVGYSKLENILNALNKKNSVDYLTSVSEGRNLIFRAFVESEALFDATVVLQFKNIYDKYNQIYLASCNMIMISDDEFVKRRTSIFEKINISSNLSDIDIVNKVRKYIATPDGINSMNQLYPEYQNICSLLREISEFYKPNNELFNMIKSYIQFENINS